MALALAAGLVLGAVQLNTIWVAMSPDVAPCSVAAFAGAFRSRLGQVAVIPGQPDLGTGEMQVVVRPGEQGLELRVRTTGQRELIRELPGPGADCFAASETAALMVERYLDEVAAGIAVEAAPPLVPLAVPASPRWGPVLEGSLTAEVGVLPQVAPGEATDIPALGPGGSIAIGVRRGSLQLSALGALEPSGATTIAGDLAPGSVHVSAYSLALSVSYLLAAGAGAVRFEFASGSQLFFANTTSPNGGRFGTPGSAFSALPFVGGGVGYELALWKGLFALTKASMRVHLGTTQLEFQGVPADTVYTRQLDGEPSLGLGYVFY